MRWRSRSLIAAGLAVASASPALACSFGQNHRFLMIPADAILMGVEAIYTLGDYPVLVASLNASIKAGDKVVIVPTVGMCRYEEGSFSETVVAFGASAGVNLWNDAAGKMSLNGQVGFEMDSFEGGSERNIPIGAAIRIKSSETMSWYAGAALNMYTIDIDGSGSHSESDPSVHGGAVFAMGKGTLSAGIVAFMGDETDLALNLGASFPMGGGSSALRKIGSLFRR
ncbi:MAG: hypothetical protein HUU26_06300 [Gemmatimonadaceae bacterium]|nr:hypothetical protein [Gemmatimonadaceae bacterium]